MNILEFEGFFSFLVLYSDKPKIVNQNIQLSFKLLVFVGLLSLYACQEDNNRKLLVKKWKVSVEELIASMPKEEQIRFRQLPPDIKKNIAIGSLEFKSNGTYIISAGFAGKQNMERGRWELRDGGKTLVTKRVGGGDQVLEILELSSERLIINPKGKEEKTKIILVPA